MGPSTEPVSTPAPFDLVACTSVRGSLDDTRGAVAMVADRLDRKAYFVQWVRELDPTTSAPFGPTSEDVEQPIVGAGGQGASVGIGFDGAIEDPYVRLRMGTGVRRALTKDFADRLVDDRIETPWILSDPGELFPPWAGRREGLRGG